MTLDLPVPDPPQMTMPPLVGRSDEKCSRISRWSHRRPTKHRLSEVLGSSKKSGLSGHWPFSTMPLIKGSKAFFSGLSG